MGQGDSARDFAPGESMKNAGILYVFPIFYTARLEQKIRRSPQHPLRGVALEATEKRPAKASRFGVEQDTGIEPASVAWEATILPMN